MPLPSSGRISTDDINEELGNADETAIDFESAADSFGVVYETDGTDPIEFDEFYGLSLDNFATSISNISPTSIISSSAEGEVHTITYTSDGNFFINADSLDWVTPNIVSGSSGSNQTFTLTTNQQALNGTSRSGNITLESPELSSNITYSVHQDDNDAILQILPQPIPTNVILYGYQGGEDEYYKIETSPESQVSWDATLSNYTNFSHRNGSSGAFVTNTISGTGDAFIYVKGNSNSSTSSLHTATITVDPTNIDDPTVTTTATVSRYPYIELSGDEVSFIGGGYTIDGLQYDDNQVSDGYTVDVDSNYTLLSATLSGTNADKFGISLSTFSFVVFSNSINNSGSSYTATVTVTVGSNPNFSISFTISQASTSPPTLSGNPTSFTWAYNEILSSNEQTFILGVTNNGNTINSVTITYDPGISTGYFKLVDYGSGDGGLAVTNPSGDVWVAAVSNPSSSTFKVNVLPTGTNSGGSDFTGVLKVNVGSSAGAVINNSIANLTHEYQQLSTFVYSDAGVSGFAVNRNTGIVTAPTSTAGTISSLTYSTGYGSGYYPLVTTNATRTVDVDITVPSGYTNSGGTVSGQESTTQLAAQESITLTTSQSSPIAATGASFSISVDVVDVWNTQWEASISYVSVGSVGDWVEINGIATGTGDGTVTNISVDTNYTNGSFYQNPRQFTVRVQKPGGAVLADLNFSQNSSSPPTVIPTTQITSPAGGTLTFAYDDTNTSTEYQTITFGRSAGSNETAATAKIQAAASGGDKFKLISTNAQTTVTEPSTDVWVATMSGVPAGSYTVGVIPQGNNTTTSNFTGLVECILGNSAGSDTENVSLIQEFAFNWSATPSSFTGVDRFDTAGETQNITLSTSVAWTAAVTGTGFSLSTTSGIAGTHTIGVTASTNTGDTRSGTVTLSATGQTDITISLSQLYAMQDLDVSWNNGFSYEEGGLTDSLTLSNSNVYREYEIYARQDYDSTVTWEITAGNSYAVWNTGGGSTSTSDQTATVGTTPVSKIIRILGNSSSSNVSSAIQVSSNRSTDLYVRTYTHTGTGGGGGKPPAGPIE